MKAGKILTEANQKKLPRLMMFISSLGGGGAERIFCDLASHFSEVGHDVSVVTLSDDQADAYFLPGNIFRIGMDIFRPSSGVLDGLMQNFLRVFELRKLIKEQKPDVLLGFLSESNVTLILASLGLNCRVVVSERSYPPNDPLSRMWTFLRKYTYRKASLLVVLSEKAVVWAKKNTYTRNVEIIQNPVTWPLKSREPLVHTKDWINEPDKLILAAGRLVALKGFDDLITAFHRSSLSQLGWKLVIAGEEPTVDSAKPRLEALVRQYSLYESVVFPGRIGNMSDWYNAADIFVLSSRYEGFPNALLEAMASGTAVISTRCNTGPEEIIEDHKSGLLVPVGDIDKLSSSLVILASDSAFRRELSNNSKQVHDRFSRLKLLKKWANALFPNIN